MQMSRRKGILTSTEFQQIMFLQTSSEAQRIEGVLRIGRISKGLVVFVFDQEFVVAFVNGGDVVLENRDQESVGPRSPQCNEYLHAERR